jgi:penicillin-binding protein 2
MAKKKDTLKNNHRETHLFTRRIIVLVVIVILATLGLMSRLFSLQVTDHNLYKTLSNQNQLSLIPIEPNRGLIMDRNGIVLADNVPIYNLVITPDKVQNLPELIKGLSQVVKLSSEDMKRFDKEMRQHRPFQPVPIKVKLSEEEVARFYVNQYKFPGVSISIGMFRHYPYGKEFVSILGYVARINEQETKEIDQANYAGSSSMGKLGIEKYYEKELHGTVGYQQVEVDANGRYVRTLKRFPPVRGDNIYLTVDSRLQLAVERILGQEKGAVVIIKPKTGEVLTLVSKPGYDPNPFVIGIDPQHYKALRDSRDKPLYNRAIRGIYPFASTIKPYLAIAGLDSGILSIGYSIRDPGFFAMGGVHHVYRDWKKEGHGTVNLPKAITVSCDVYFYGLAVRLGVGRMYTYLRKFGFGQLSGIDLNEELAGLVPSPEWKRKKLHAKWFIGDTIVAGIGQGYMLATPLQLAQGVAVIANKGLRFRPHLLLKFEKPDGTLEELKPIAEPPVILKNKKNWNVVIDAMGKVTSSLQGTAAVAFAKTPYIVAGKTGTAQLTRIVGENTHGSDASLPKHLRNHKLFISFAPIEDPQIAMAVLIENSTLAPKVAREIYDYYFGATHQFGLQAIQPIAADGSEDPVDDGSEQEQHGED